MSHPKIIYWRGKPVTEMTRDELVEALTCAAELMEMSAKNAERERGVWAEITRAHCRRELAWR